MIFSFGSFLLRATSAIPSNVAKSFTTIALIQSELAAKTERSYCLSQEIISYTNPIMPSFSASSFNLATV